MSQEHDNELMDRVRGTAGAYYRLALVRHIRLLDKLPQDCGHSGPRTADGRCAICGRSL